MKIPFSVFLGPVWWIVRRLTGVLACLALVVMVVSSLCEHSMPEAVQGVARCGGDARMLSAAYGEIGSARDRQVWEAAAACYRMKYAGADGGWKAMFRADLARRNGRPDYADLLEVVPTLATDADRMDFVATHLPAYEGCLAGGFGDAARIYAGTLREIRERGGRDWEAVARNPFAVCVFDAVRGFGDLWTWYRDQASWCDAYLETLSPGGDLGLPDALATIREHAGVFRRLGEELDALADDEVCSLAATNDSATARSACRFAAIPCVVTFGAALDPLLEAGAPMLESLSVLANSADAFALETDDERRAAGRELAALYRGREPIWKLAASADGVGALRLFREVPGWAGTVLGRYGHRNVASFLLTRFAEEPRLLAAATETLARCQEPGWAVLATWGADPRFRRLLGDPRIGFRVVPYILRKGEQAAWTDLEKDPRWVDEYFDADGNLKRPDVSWYELSPIGGDLLTVCRKWAENRPLTMGELGWGAFDVVDGVAMAFSFGLSKVATGGAKVAGRAAAKSAGAKTAARAVERRTLRVEQGFLKVGRATEKTARAGRLSFLRRAGTCAHEWMKGRRAGLSVGRLSAETMRNLHRMPPSTWRTVFRVSTAAMWIGWAHALDAKGADYAAEMLAHAGKLVDELVRAMTDGTLDALKRVIRRVFAQPDTWYGRLATAMLGIVPGLLLALLGVRALMPRRDHPTRAAVWRRRSLTGILLGAGVVGGGWGVVSGDKPDTGHEESADVVRERRIRTLFAEALESVAERGNPEALGRLCSEFMSGAVASNAEDLCVANVLNRLRARTQETLREEIARLVVDRRRLDLATLQLRMDKVAAYPFPVAADRAEADRAIAALRRLLQTPVFHLESAQVGRLQTARQTYLVMAFSKDQATLAADARKNLDELVHTDLKTDIQPAWSWSGESRPCVSWIPGSPVRIEWRWNAGYELPDTVLGIWEGNDALAFLRVLRDRLPLVKPKGYPNLRAPLEGASPLLSLRCVEFPDAAGDLAAIERFLLPGTYWLP